MNAIAGSPDRPAVGFSGRRSEMLPLFAAGAALAPGVVGGVPLQGAQSPLNLAEDAATLLVNRVALGEQHLPLLLQMLQLLANALGGDRPIARLAVVLENILEFLALRLRQRPGRPMDEFAHLGQRVVNARL